MAAVDCATQVIAFRPTCFEAYWARAKARRELNELAGALADLREAAVFAAMPCSHDHFLTKTL